MIIAIQNTIGAIRSFLGIVVSGLKMFLPFSSSQQLGEELVANGDYLNGLTGWTTQIPSGQVVEVVNNQLHIKYDASTISSTGVFQEILVSGKTYITIIDVESVTGTFKVQVGNQVNTINTSGIKTFTNTSSDVGLFIARKLTGSNGISFEATINSITVKEVGQFSLDETTNNNNAKLFTGNALDFDGSGDYVQVPNSNAINLGIDDFTIVFWINKVASGSGTQRVIDKRNTKGYTVYLDTNNVLYLELNDGTGNTGFSLGTISDDVYQRIVISAERSGSATCYIDNVAQTPVNISSKQLTLDDSTDLFIGGDAPAGNSINLNGNLADVQLWNVAWSATDVANDYANPNQLVSSVSVSNLKGWWAMTEGSGSVAVDNATAPGSELVTDGNFPTGTNAWSPSASGVTFGNGFVKILKESGSGSTDAYIYQDILQASKSYKVVFSGVITSGTLFFGVNGDTAAQKIFTAGTYSNESFVFTASAALFQIRNPNTGSTINATITNVSVKEISAGTIIGATYEPAQSSILQLGMINWSNGSNVFLPPSPSNATQDILGNAVRDRQNSLNLTGTGVAEVTDNNSLDFGTGDFSVETWAKWDFVNSGSSYNTIYSNGGLVTATSNFGLVSSSTGDKIRFIVNNTNCISTSTFSNGDWVHIVGTRESGSLKLYINGNKTPEATASNSDTVTNALVKSVGKDAQTFRFYHNLIDDVRVYDRAITATEVEQNYKAGTSAHTN